MKAYNVRWSAKVYGNSTISAPDEETAQQIFFDDTVGNLNPDVDTADDFDIDDIYEADNPIGD